MIIQHNLLAGNAKRQSNTSGARRKKATERLSSGYRINRAADDAAGLSISEKMRGQIRGLTRAAQNVQDGIALCQIADGGLSEISDIMHRLTELSVQSANDTNVFEDRQAIQKEVDALISEIDRISETTEYNGMKLFSSTITIEGSVMSQEDAISELSSGNIMPISYDILDNEGNVIISKNAANALIANMSCYYKVSELYDEYKNGLLQYDGRNGVQTTKTADMMELFTDALEYWAKWKEADIDDVISTKRTLVGQFKNASIAVDRGPTSRPDYNPDHATRYATDFTCEGILYHNDTLLQKLGDVQIVNGTRVTDSGYDFCHGYHYSGYVAMHAATSNYNREDFSFSSSLANLLSSMRKIPGEDQAEVNSTLSSLTNSLADKDSIATLYSYLKSSASITVNAPPDIWIQSGANSGDSILLKFDCIDAGTLGVSGLNVSSHESAENAISRVSNGLGTLLSARSNIGAYQNRLEHAYSVDQNTAENTQAAESRIRDTDMAKEMMEYAKSDILNNAAQAMIAQANRQPEGVLKILS